jgi:DNA repair protein RadB
MLSGGIESGCLTLIYGEAGTGKTNLCLTLAKNLA